MRYGYYRNGFGVLTITNNTSDNISVLGCLMIEARGDGTYWGPVFHGETGQVNDCTEFELTFGTYQTIKGTLNNNGSNWWAFLNTTNVSDIVKAGLKDYLAINVGKTIDWEIIFY